MRKSLKDGATEDGEPSKPAVRRSYRRQAVIKTDRAPEEWTPTVAPQSENPPREEASPVQDTPLFESVSVCPSVRESEPQVKPSEPEVVSQPPVRETVPPSRESEFAVEKFEAALKPESSAAQSGILSTAPSVSQDGGLTPQEQRAARWGRFPRNGNRRGRHGGRFEREVVERQQGGAQGGGRPNVPGGAQSNPSPTSQVAGAEGEAAVVREPTPPSAPLPTILLKDLEELSAEALNARVEEVLTPEEIAGKWRRHELINSFVRAYMNRQGTVYTSGIIEVANDGTGFLRSERSSYLSCPEDVYVSQQYVRRFNLRTGDFIEGPIRDPRLRQDRGKEKFLAIGHIDKVNGRTPADWRRVIPFENLTPVFPDRRIFLETKSDDLSMRIMNLFAPIGFGQRGIIVAPPRTGKTVLMQKIANAITANHPDAYLIVLLIDERPEEVTDMQRNTKAHVVSSTFDEAPERHAQVAEMVIEMSKRMVESGKDVVILLDSITRLARAYNTLQPNTGRILSGGVDAMGLHKPKRFFGAARNIENGGSLTIIATALIDTGSRMDEVIFEEFKGTGNMELVLDRGLSDKRIYPAINIDASGTRKEDLILHPDELTRIWSIRKALSGMPPADAVETVIKAMKKSQNNAEFLMNIVIKD